MRKVLSVLAAVVLVGTVASSSLAAAPPTVNRFVGQFDMVDFDMTTIVGHVAVNVTEATEGRLVPGTLDITWAPGNEVRESHAQLVSAEFGEMSWEDDFSPTGTFHAIYAMVQGDMCNYRGPGDASCEPFAMMFQQITDFVGPTANKVGFSAAGSMECCGGSWYPAAKTGAWALTYMRPTNP